ncbi:alpha/beta hydrolase [Bifidobacterium eulemuris]|uniref:Alpha/beta hydrolase n=1 Tax=Bifidobacterium eulemuris TaxID=1765219 RepID=A0A261GDH6_9BIFI|nr:alpha/beta hydrolase [Bifidobacterium eulemuris]OZG69492.1 esterase/lipase [Bifidobacterium eulemuris]QOL32150.1 alpha/beta hydrolase [Bifidobacterium eulemuris]
MELDRLGRKLLLDALRLKDAGEVWARVRAYGHVYDRLETHLDLPYLADGIRAHRLDVYGDTQGAAGPVLVVIHGGGWVAGSKATNESQAKYFASRGFRVVNINYRLQPETDFAGQLADIFAALDWVAAHARDYGFDMDRLFVTGDSAGGHLTLLTALTASSPALREYYGVRADEWRIRAVAVSCPASDLRGDWSQAETSFRLLGSLLFDEPRKDAEYARMASIEYVLPMGELPPTFILTTPDDALLYAHTRRLHEVLDKRGVAHRYREYHAQNRAKLQHVFNVTNPEWPESRRANTDILTFFNELQP